MSRSMTRLRAITARLRGAGPGDRTGDLRWGVAGLLSAVLLTAGLGVVGAVGTTDERTYAAELSQAGALRTGDDIRLAGVPVGRVRSLTLLADRVRMTFTVRDDVFLGDATGLDIRMLTVVGGYYVALRPAGTVALGQTVIPRERVVLPYNLTKIFQDAIAPVRAIDGTTVRDDLAALSGSIEGGPEALRSALRATDDLVSLMNTQNAEISRALTVADEYLSALDGASDSLAQLVRMLRALETLVQTNKASVAQALDDLSDVLRRLSPLGRAWDRDLHQRVQPLVDSIGGLQNLVAQLGSLFDAVRGLEERLLPLLADGTGARVDHSAVTVVPDRICVPVPGGGC
ncbi:MlaD family protein [Nocardia asteroides]|uniref:MlaD family protein n=1 Tax=Nocardia asteroides TaxID=1824 RepID=UPI0037C753F2